MVGYGSFLADAPSTLPVGRDPRGTHRSGQGQIALAVLRHLRAAGGKRDPTRLGAQLGKERNRSH